MNKHDLFMELELSAPLANLHPVHGTPRNIVFYRAGTGTKFSRPADVKAELIEKAKARVYILRVLQVAGFTNQSRLTDNELYGYCLGVTDLITLDLEQEED